MRKVMSREADADETDRFHKLHLERSRDVLEMSTDDLFIVKTIHMELPAKARLEPSEPCGRCGEPTMRTKLEDKSGLKLCRDCLEQSSS